MRVSALSDRYVKALASCRTVASARIAIHANQGFVNLSEL